ncbi:isochorismatase hydrolase [Mycena leptocephala]|nr:isochorismatase hydrolase [Mycena leptocephala]
MSKMACPPIHLPPMLTAVLTGFKLVPYSDMEFFPELNDVIGKYLPVPPVIHVHHASLGEDSPLNPKLCPEGYAVLPEAAPVGEEVIFVKNVNSGFIGTGLEAHLRATQIDTLVILGLTTSHCLHDEFATVITTDEIVYGVERLTKV